MVRGLVRTGSDVMLNVVVTIICDVLDVDDGVGDGSARARVPHKPLHTDMSLTTQHNSYTNSALIYGF